ncbi:hypothetical protein L083_4029 [Actinoplanes sp. N902-109]|nr:hypothetical protein L083_4029 [Actinoplanes sp. N902-109]
MQHPLPRPGRPLTPSLPGSGIGIPRVQRVAEQLSQEVRREGPLRLGPALPRRLGRRPSACANPRLPVRPQVNRRRSVTLSLCRVLLLPVRPQVHRRRLVAVRRAPAWSRAQALPVRPQVHRRRLIDLGPVAARGHRRDAAIRPLRTGHGTRVVPVPDRRRGRRGEPRAVGRPAGRLLRRTEPPGVRSRSPAHGSTDGVGVPGRGVPPFVLAGRSAWLSGGRLVELSLSFGLRALDALACTVLRSAGTVGLLGLDTTALDIVWRGGRRRSHRSHTFGPVAGGIRIDAHRSGRRSGGAGSRSRRHRLIGPRRPGLRRRGLRRALGRSLHAGPVRPDRSDRPDRRIGGHRPIRRIRSDRPDRRDRLRSRQRPTRRRRDRQSRFDRQHRLHRQGRRTHR